MDTIFMNHKNSETSDPYSLLLNLSDKITYREVINMLPYEAIAYTIHKNKNVIQKQ